MISKVSWELDKSLVKWHPYSEVISLSVSFVAVHSLKSFSAFHFREQMGLNMLFQISLLGKTLVTNLAGVGLISCMHAGMV